MPKVTQQCSPYNPGCLPTVLKIQSIIFLPDLICSTLQLHTVLQLVFLEGAPDILTSGPLHLHFLPELFLHIFTWWTPSHPGFGCHVYISVFKEDFSDSPA